MTKISHKLEKQEQRFPKSFGDRTRWRLATTLRFLDQLDSDTGSTRQELPSIVAKKQEWDILIKSMQVCRKKIKTDHQELMASPE